MNTSGEAADQVMRMMLNGTEVLVKLTGSGAKNAAVLLYTILRQQKKTKGAARLESMLRSGKPLKIYTFQDRDLQKFKEAARQYGVLYTVLKEKDRTDGVFDVMVRAEDESKLARITERFGLARVDSAGLRTEIMREKQDAEHGTPEADKTEKSEDEALVDEILGKSVRKEENGMENPTAARMEITGQTKDAEPQEGPSERFSETVCSDGKSDRRPSVRKRMEEIRQKRKERAKEEATKLPERKKESVPKERG